MVKLGEMDGFELVNKLNLAVAVGAWKLNTGGVERAFTELDEDDLTLLSLSLLEDD